MPLIAYDAIWQFKTAANTVPPDPAAVSVPGSGYSSGQAPFGTIGDLVTNRPPNTAWAVDTGLWIRRGVVVDGEHGLLLEGQIENAFFLYFDGDYMGSFNPGNDDLTAAPSFMAVIPRELATAGTHEIALLCLDESGGADGNTFAYLTADYLPPLMPLWPRPNLRETLEWMTNVMIAKDGTEDPDQLRLFPRQTFQNSYFVPHAMQPRVVNMIRGARGQQWLVPAWPQVQHIGAVAAGEETLAAETDYAELRDGSLIMLWESADSYQVLGIKGVATSGTIDLLNITEAFDDAWLVPVRLGYLEGNPARGLNGRNSSLDMAFVVEDNAAINEVFALNIEANSFTSDNTASGGIIVSARADQTFTITKPRVEESGGLLMWDAYSAWPSDGATTPISPPVPGRTWTNAFHVYGSNGGAETLLWSGAGLSGSLYLTEEDAWAALAALTPLSFTGYTQYRVTCPTDTNLGDNRNGISVLAQIGAPAQYLGLDIYYEPSLIEGDALNEEIVTAIDMTDPGLGPVAYYQPWTYNRPARGYRVTADGHAEAWALREWLHRRAGRYRLFWQPTFEVDMRPTSTGALTTSLRIAADEYLAYAEDRSHIAVETASGWLPRAITDAVRLSASEIQLTLDSSLAINASDIKRVCFLSRRRLDTDRIELVWKGEAVCQMAVATVEIKP